MDHLNIFNSFRNKENSHEDELTRAFLILVENIPMIQGMFINCIREDMINKRCKHIIPDLFSKESSIESIKTQITDSNYLFKQAVERRVVSIIISDDKLSKETKVKNSNRRARYDGVIIYEPSWLLIIENKPSVENVWLEQLNPNVSDDIEIEEKPIALSWREILEKVNSLIEKKLLNGLEEKIVSDFIEFIDNNYPELNPYTTFVICNDNNYLLKKRCTSIMKALNLGEVKQHQGWETSIEIDNKVVKKIALYPELKNNSWEIILHMSAGSIMSYARNFYNSVNIDRLKKIQMDDWELKPELHFAFRSQFLMKTEITCNLDTYLEYWINNISNLKQVKREDIINYHKMLMDNGMAVTSDIEKIKDKILKTKMQKVNICPSIYFRYIWKKEGAIKLDRDEVFISEVKNKIREAFSVWE